MTAPKKSFAGKSDSNSLALVKGIGFLITLMESKISRGEFA